MSRQPAKTIFRCYCGHDSQGQQAKNQHMRDVHGMKYGYQNVGKTGNKKSGWKKQSVARQKNLKERGAG